MTPDHDTTEEHRLRLIVRDEVTQLIGHHVATCSFVADHHPERVRHLETANARLIGYMVGSGLIAGGIGAELARALFQ